MARFETPGRIFGVFPLTNEHGTNEVEQEVNEIFFLTVLCDQFPSTQCIETSTTPTHQIKRQMPHATINAT
jgi:hypothetical protein